MPERLLNDETLSRSEVVANASMNRGRGLGGRNSYALDLGFDVLATLRGVLRTQGRVAWLDLCCGSGRALIEAAEALRSEGLEDRAALDGVDLIPMFDAPPDGARCLRLLAAPVGEWQPERRYDLITCVHGLHYVGDKLGLVARAAEWLTDDGRFLTHLDPANLRLRDGSPAGPAALRLLRRAGFRYDPRRRLLALTGGRAAERMKEEGGRMKASHGEARRAADRSGSFILHPSDFILSKLRYLGADDAAGPNCTGQPAVNSFYELLPVR